MEGKARYKLQVTEYRGRMLKEIQDCFRSERILFTKHARDEMEGEEFGEVREKEVFEPCKVEK